MTRPLRGLAPFAAMILLLPAALALLPVSAAHPEPAPLAPPGAPPSYADGRALSVFANRAAVSRVFWVPGLERGYVPQGLAIADGSLFVSGYGESEAPAATPGGAWIYRVHPQTGAVQGKIRLPDSVQHAGGLVYDGNGSLFLADTRRVLRIALAASLNRPNAIAVITGEARLGGALRGSFIAHDGAALWIGRYDPATHQVLSRIDPLLISGGRLLTEANASGKVRVPALTQGAAFDALGMLWLSQSNSKRGRLQRVDPHTGIAAAEHDFAPGVEGLAFAPDGVLWTLSEAGARRYLNWKAFHPLLLALDVSKLN